jgi:peptidoglycan/LPS O-acetylase OafA/YrhL
MIAQEFATWPTWLQTCALLLMAAICFGLIVGCICRIDLLNGKGKRHRFGWVLCYACYAAAGAAVLLDMAHTRAAPSDAAALGILALSLNILLTQRSWGNGPPKVMEKP